MLHCACYRVAVGPFRVIYVSCQTFLGESSLIYVAFPCCWPVMQTIILVLSDESDNDVHQLVLHVVECQRAWLASHDESCVIRLDVGVVPDGAQGGLGEQGLEVVVAETADVRPPSNARSRLVLEGCHADVAGQFARIQGELHEVGRQGDEGRGVDHPPTPLMETMWL